MSRWTPQSRAKQADLIRTWRPWEKSTRPTTPEGKARASANSRKHGLFDARSRDLIRNIHELLREQRQALRRL